LPLHTGVEICAAAKRAGDEITEREVTVLLGDFATVWSELFPAEQARIVLIIIGYATGWFGGAPAPVPQQ
jgi:hypothetical protein